MSSFLLYFSIFYAFFRSFLIIEIDCFNELHNPPSLYTSTFDLYMFADKIINKNVTATSTNKEINAPPIPTVSFAKRTGIIYEDKNGIYEVIRITILFGSEAPSINPSIYPPRDR